MSRMLALEREIALTWGPDVEGPGISEQTSEGRRQLLAVPDGRALLRARDVTAVGFFGRLREDVDHAVLFEHERRIARRSRATPRSASSATWTSGRNTAGTAT